MTTSQASTSLHRCTGCGAWSLGWCAVCRRIASQRAQEDALEAAHAQAEGSAHRGALEAAMPGTGYQHRPSDGWADPHRGAGAHNPHPPTP